jgi:ankyrin repeat protein
MAKQAILLGEFDKFIARLALMEKIFVNNLGRELDLLEKADVLAFLDGVQLYQSPEKHLELFKNKVGSQQSKAKEVFDIVKPLKFQENYATYGFSGCYTIKELTQYLQILEDTICNCCQDCNDVPDNIGFQLTSNKHTIILNYDIKNKLWNIIDANILWLGVSYFKKMQDSVKELRKSNNADAMTDNIATWLCSYCFSTLEVLVEEVNSDDEESTTKPSLVEEVNSDDEEPTTKPSLVEEVNINQLKIAMYTEMFISNKFSVFKNKFIEKLNNNNTWKSIHTVTKDKISLDKTASSWLYIAVACGDFGKAKLLIAELIDAGYTVDQTNDTKISLLLLAVNNGDIEMVRLLIDNKANVNQVNQVDNDGSFFPLLVAAASDHAEIVRLLIDANVNVDQSNDEGFSSLYIAALKGYTQIVKLLIDAGAKINDKRGVFSPLWAAAEKGHAKIIEMLIEKGANINEVNWQGVSYLDVAVRNSHVEVAELLAKDATIGILKQAKQNISQNSKSTELLEDIINKAIEKATLKHKEPILLRSISSNSNKKQNAVCEKEISMEIRQNSKTMI